eukprot:11524506-Ditylum_brightwellii.AAC.1
MYYYKKKICAVKYLATWKIKHVPQLLQILIAESVPTKYGVQSSLSAKEDEEPDEATTVAAAATCITEWDDDKFIQSAVQ